MGLPQALPSGPFRVLHENALEDREGWRELRRVTGVSASKIPVVLGLSPFESALHLWAWYRGEVPDAEETDAMWWGSALQPLVGQRIAKDEGLIYVQDERLVQSTKHELVLATCDNWYFTLQGIKDSLGEIKTVKTGDYWENGIPEYVKAQCQGQMFCTGEERIRVGVFFRAEAAHFWDWVERDDAFIEHIMLPGIEEFWDLVRKGVPPSTDGLETTTEAIKATWPKAEAGKIIELPKEFAGVADELDSVKKELKEVQKRERALKNQVMAALGDAEIGNIEGTSEAFSYKNQHRDGYTVEPTDFRVLRKTKRVAA